MSGEPVVGVSVTQFTALSRDINNIGNIALRQEWRAAMLKAGNIVAEQARENAGWSSRIPGSIRVSVTTKGVAVRAGGAAAPHAVTFEGNAQGGARRHPVFARGPRPGWTWAPQNPPRPYLLPALNSNLDNIASTLADGIDAIFKANGFTAQ